MSLGADAGPMLSFARAQRLELLRSVVGTLLIPEAAYDDIAVRGAGKPGAQEVQTSIWIRRERISHTVARVVHGFFCIARAITSENDIGGLVSGVRNADRVCLHMRQLGRRIDVQYRFLSNKNRLNVGDSGAQSLAIVVGNPVLARTEVSCMPLYYPKPLVHVSDSCHPLCSL